MPWPAAEVDVDEALARALLRAQHPDLADRPLAVVANGWDNVVLRLGDDLAVRLPRRAAAAELVANELRWLPGLAARLPLPIAAPVRAGTPSKDDPAYPFPWSVCRWIDGTTAVEWTADPGDVDRLGAFLWALHRPAPDDAPRSQFRGVPLADRHDRVVAQLEQVGDAIDVAAIRRTWDELRDLPPWPHEPVWLHGDLHPGNMVVGADGRLAGIIDFGDLCAGDPATDLSVAWMVGAPGVRGDHDDATWGRAKGWALVFGLLLLAHSTDVPAFAALGRRTVAAVLAEN